MDKELLRRAFGEINDTNPVLEGIFGNTYLDNPDIANEGIPPEISKILDGHEIVNIGSLLGNAIENAPLQDCKSNQDTIIKFLKEHILEQGTVSYDEWFRVMHHMDTCCNEVCGKLYDISILDTFLNVDELRSKYNNIASKLGLEKI